MSNERVKETSTPPAPRAPETLRAASAAALLRAAVLGVLAALVPAPASAALPVPASCQNDADGANDQPGQRDITRFCLEVGDGMPFEYYTLANWDETTLTGANTADICRLFDSDGDGLVDFASCVTLVSSGVANGNLAVLGALRLYTCTDTSPDRCTGSALVPGPYGTVCEVGQRSTDPFGPSVPNGPGAKYPDDTEILCGLDLDDFGAPDVRLVDACAYPSSVPNSAPSDCILFRACTSDAECDDLNPCTADSCNTSIGACDHDPTPGEPCSDALFCNGDEICNELGFCENVAPRECDDGVACTIDDCDELNDVCVHDPRDSLCPDGFVCDPLEGCVPGAPECGDGVVTPPEECDPPETAGTFEDCNNLVDDDGDGRVDCRDTDCAPEARDPLCDEQCTFDQVCEKLIKDPATIGYRWDGLPDALKLHGRFRLQGEPDPLGDGAVFQFSNRHGAIYRVALGAGDLAGKPGRKRFTFVDKSARELGADSPSGGLYRLGIVLRLWRGVPYLAFRIKAYGDFSAAVEPAMTVQISVGAQVGALTAEWKAKPGKWTLRAYE